MRSRFGCRGGCRGGGCCTSDEVGGGGGGSSSSSSSSSIRIGIRSYSSTVIITGTHVVPCFLGNHSCQWRYMRI